MSRADADRSRRQHGAFFLADGGRRRRRRARAAAAIASYGYTRTHDVADALPARRGAGRPGGARAEEHPDHRGRRTTTSGSAPASGDAPPREHHRAADPVRGPGARRDRAGVASRAFSDDPPDVPRPADGDASASCSTRSSPTCAPRSCSQQSQSLTQELQSSRRSSSRTSCEEAQPGRNIEVKNHEIELARAGPRGEGRPAGAVLAATSRSSWPT